MSTVTTKSWNEAVVRQFPWLDAAIQDREGKPFVPRLTERIVVAKTGREILEVAPSEVIGTQASGYSTSDQIEFWSEDGEKLGEVAPRQSHADADEMKYDQEGETVADALANLEGPGAVRFITRYEYESSSAIGHQPESHRLTIYKVSTFDIEVAVRLRAQAADAALNEGLRRDYPAGAKEALQRFLNLEAGTPLSAKFWREDGGANGSEGEAWVDAIEPWAFPVQTNRGGALVMGLYDVHASSRVVAVEGEVIALISTSRGERYVKSVRPLEGGTYYTLTVCWISPDDEGRKLEYWLES